MRAVEQLLAHWTAQGLPLAKGVPEADLRGFESRHGVALPDDLRSYFTAVDGLVQRGGVDVDRDGFAFWPLESVEPVPAACRRFRASVPALPDAERYFVFADYLQWSWAYAIRLGTAETPVIFVGAANEAVVATSFSEFVALYVQDAPALYRGF